MKQVEIFIIGHGIAGTLLSYFLDKHHISHHVIDPQHHDSASMVAAGLMDYISGKRLTKSWKADLLIPFALQTYRALEQTLNTSFLTQTPSLRLFLTEEERRAFDKKHVLEEFLPHYTPCHSHTFSFLHQPPQGGTWITSTASISTKAMLLSHYEKLYSEHRYSNGTYTPSSLTSPYVYDDICARRVVFCTGAHTMTLPYLSHLPFRPAQGETLTLSIPSLPSDHVTNLGKWFVPIGPSLFKFGATYEWKHLSPTPSIEGKTELLSFINTAIKGSISIKDHQAGVRCMTSDVRPFIGFLSQHPSIGVLSGFGSKGVMMAPYYAAQLASHIAQNTPIDDDVSINRF